MTFSPPTISDEEIEAVVAALRSNWITSGPKTQEFERRFAQKFGLTGALATSSCTAALHTALLVSGIGKGAEVITTPMTFAASVNVIEHVGARPVFVDVEPDTLNLNPSLLEGAMTDATRAVLPVHYAGHPVDLDSVMAAANDHHCSVIEDAAHAVAARYRGNPIGSHGNLTAFSFYATKNLTTAEGGMLTGDVEMLARAEEVRLHGMTRNAWKRYDKSGSWRYDIVFPGYKYNMTDIQAAMGLVQLEKLDRFQLRRREIACKYREAFALHDAIQVPVERRDVSHAWHLFAIRLRLEALTIDRDQFVAELALRNIGTSVHFIPVHTFTYYAQKYGYAPTDFPVAYDSFTRLLSLPLHPLLSESDVTDVIEAVYDICKRYRR